eukprot:CAMPEP_0177664696 /NCGR_PEP_ID=MMETSP0447-20121125/20645_1 /TAXON_ID=0 /ORGANISM="Stygamoeba regulata, Strain BSH-02190019" /LENGTH=502 /DNA_ID=CAMNT_0019170713 /DNA_START=88 /DNA_END=1596 /DNA_ORIENTATION=+
MEQVDRLVAPVAVCSAPTLHNDATKMKLSVHNISEKVLAARYAVRGEVVARAGALKKKLQEGGHGLPFDRVIHCNIGNPQEVGQQPITFFRQVISLVEYPALLDRPEVTSIFPRDAIEHARHLLSFVTTTGAYSESQGVLGVRKAVAQFIAARDGVPATEDNIFLTDGASPGIKSFLQLLLRNEDDAVMIPIPQYPLYSASISLLGGSQAGYYLDEENGWALTPEELERSFREATVGGQNIRALVVINPGNPTGQVFTEDNIRQICEFAARRHIMIMADEVYQENIYYDNKPFVSFKKVVSDMLPKYPWLSLVSFHSTSKGFIGECGKRGGYMELVNICPSVQQEILKLQSVNLCSNVVGQMMVELMVNPPKPGDPSYELYNKEKTDILVSLKRRSQMLAKAFNDLPGVSCQVPEGAMYAFPQVSIPRKAEVEAQRIGKTPDELYVLEMLDATGIVVVPGSGFRQKDGTHHFRTTFLPSEDQIDSVVDRLSKFHVAFLEKYK